MGDAAGSELCVFVFFFIEGTPKNVLRVLGKRFSSPMLHRLRVKGLGNSRRMMDTTEKSVDPVVTS